MENINVLIFPSGSGVSKEIFDSLKYIRWIKIIGLDTDENNFAHYQFANNILGIPLITYESDAINFLKDVIKKYDIDCIYPAMDSIIYFLKKYEEDLNVKIITSELLTCEICLSKKKTYELLMDTILTPKIYANVEEQLNYPVFIKPECGYGSRDSYKIDNVDEYRFYMKKRNDYITCEYLPGEEYTVDCFNTVNKGLLFCEARTRTKTINGMSVLTKSINIPEAKTIANKILEKLHFRGAWFFQIKKNKDEEYVLLEIAPRIPGAMSLHRNVGINFPLLTLFDHFGYDIDDVLINNYDITCYKTFENRYTITFEYDIVYIDLDDTIIIKDKVNTKIIQYIYHLKNLGKSIILITKNLMPYDCLKKYHIDSNLFREIIRCERNEHKIDFIDKTCKCIFIDDSYAERKEVFIHGINVFNCDMIESLFDEKF